MSRTTWWLSLGLVVLCIAVLPAPTAAQGRPEGSLVVYSAADAELVSVTVAAFGKKHPDIKVSTVVAGTGELLKRIEAERARPLGDIAWSLGLEAVTAKKALFEPYVSGEAAKFVPGLAPADNVWTPFTALVWGIMYNKKLVSEAEKPRAWGDVLAPKWKGKVAFADATKSGSSYTTLVTWLTLHGKGEPAWKFVEDMVRQTKILPRSAMTPKGVADGEFALGFFFDQGYLDFLKGGAPVGFVYPSEGVAVIPDGSALIKNAPHPNAAKLFLEFTVSREIQQMLVDKFGRRAVRRDVATPPGVPPLDGITAIVYDMEWAGTARTELLKKYQDVLIKTQ